MTDESDEEYEKCLEEMDKHISRASDGTFLVDTNGFPWGFDAEMMQDLRDSISVTNDMIRSGELDPKSIEN